MFKTIRVGLVTVAAVSSYAYFLRPRMLSAGATEAEIRRALPGDELVPAPRSVSTRAITIHAPASAIWPWLVQIGQGRGGWYSYEWVERLGGGEIKQVDRMLPEYQHLNVGDIVRLTSPERSNLFFTVVVEDPGRALVLRTPLPPGGDRRESLEAGYPDGSWAFVLEPIDDQTTRLIVRWRSDYKPTVAGMFFNQYGLEPVHFLMERKMLLGFKERVERAAGQTPEQIVPATPGKERRKKAVVLSNHI
jgi:hypothetical protein